MLYIYTCTGMLSIHTSTSQLPIQADLQCGETCSPIS